MKIALVCVHYPPLRSSCAIQMRDLAQEFRIQGHEPIVIVPTENMEQPWRCEMVDGVSVFRLRVFKTIDVGYARRAFNEMLLPFIMLYRLRRSDFPIYKLDAVVWYSPTIFFGPLVKALKQASQCPAYLILRDIFPEWAVDLGIIRKGPVYYLFKLVAKYQYSIANVIGVQTPSNLAYLQNWLTKPTRQLEVLNNWLSKSLRRKSSILIEKTHLRGRKIFIYIGNMGIAQGMDILLELAASFKDRQDLGFLFVGRGSEVERLRLFVKSKGLDNVLFFDEIDSSEIQSLLAMSHVALLALDPRHKSHNIPGKFLSYIQAGLPVLARVNPRTDLIGIIETERVGFVYTGDKTEELRKLAETLVDSQSEMDAMSERGRLLSKKIFSSKKAVTQVVSALTNKF